MARRDRAGRTGRCDRDRVCPGAGRAAYAADGHCSRTRASDVRGLVRAAGRAGRRKAENRRETCIEAGRGAAARDQAGAQSGRRPRAAAPGGHTPAAARVAHTGTDDFGAAGASRADRRAAGRARARSDHAQHVERGADMENADRGAARAQQALSGKRAISPPGRSRPGLFQPRPAGAGDRRCARSRSRLANRGRPARRR